jgi:hypothetical protein
VARNIYETSPKTVENEEENILSENIESNNYEEQS